MSEDRAEQGVSLNLDDATTLYDALEAAFEAGLGDAAAQRAYRTLGWRILAAGGGTGLGARLSTLAREAETLEEFEAARDQELGPILDALEDPLNRDP
ncbi:Hypothetical Protein RradSPS_1150 [Rubrobacter radiotolerans]|uniref:Uncharacterized protein n=1 Tax=Rubrobacter radiotolerans TaxID=42256 RepID=A0A023X249_RUBRA|nr:hypothetical protein [Rubrobacter radiotolerans]AHY46433.1 Hypothetical Protein RradSPS_1150 [Rubrobacter radiotolerans]MDX5893840.1 hypothetical protein [Rubrobacter radiotolerans]SMC04602.1 conserved hypothetical protein [Rubrobacter radiotolerans DSM 5868]